MRSWATGGWACAPTITRPPFGSSGILSDFPVAWLGEVAAVAGFRLSSGQLLEVFGPNDAGVQTTNGPVVGFKVKMWPQPVRN